MCCGEIMYESISENKTDRNKFLKTKDISHKLRKTALWTILLELNKSLSNMLIDKIYPA